MLFSNVMLCVSSMHVALCLHYAIVNVDVTDVMLPTKTTKHRFVKFVKFPTLENILEPE